MISNASCKSRRETDGEREREWQQRQNGRQSVSCVVWTKRRQQLKQRDTHTHIYVHIHTYMYVCWTDKSCRGVGQRARQDNNGIKHAQPENRTKREGASEGAVKGALTTGDCTHTHTHTLVEQGASMSHIKLIAVNYANVLSVRPTTRTRAHTHA